METMSKSPWPMADAARPRLLRCNAAADTEAEPTTSSSTQRHWEKPKMRPAFHFRPDLQPVSRFSEAELRQHWLALVNFVLEGRDAALIIERLRLLGLAEDDEVLEAIKGWVTSSSDRANDDSPSEVLSPGDIERLYTKSTHAEAIPIPDPAGLEEHSLQFIRTDFEGLDNSRFEVLWAKGEPMVLDNVDKRLKLSWTPDDFIERFGDEPCGECRTFLSEVTVTCISTGLTCLVVVDCQTNKPHSSSIRNFFRSFKEADTRGKAILKLKVRSGVVDCWEMDRSDMSRTGQRPTISRILTRDCTTIFATPCLYRTTLAEKECSTSTPMYVSRIGRRGVN
jgi:lysine-specific demethylase 3